MATFVHYPEGKITMTETTLNEIVLAVARAKDMGLKTAWVSSRECGICFAIQLDPQRQKSLRYRLVKRRDAN